MNENISILVVDDDEILRQRLEKAFARRGFRVRTAHDFDSAISVATEFQPDRAVLDLKMPGRSGLELLSELLRVSPHTKAVILTGYGSITNAVEAVKLGAINYVTKPADADQQDDPPLGMAGQEVAQPGDQPRGDRGGDVPVLDQQSALRPRPRGRGHRQLLPRVWSYH